jgi:NADH dehydrogenase
VWTAGVRPHPLVETTDLPLDEKKRIRCTAALQVLGAEGAWAAGDCAAVPDLSKLDGTAFTSPSAQHAVRQAKLLAENIISTLRGGSVRDYKHAYAGSVASLGLHKGVAEIYGVKLRGLPAWFMHRTYHLSRMPTLNRKVRVAADWSLALFFHREIVSLGAFANPREDFESAAAP